MTALRRFVGFVDRVNHRIGRAAMYGLFIIMAILLWSSMSKAFFNPSLWTLETAQFAMAAYYTLGGPYSIQMGSNARMDLLYGALSDRGKAAVDSVTVFFLIFYLAVLLWGGIDSAIYAFQYGGERSPTAWRPYLWPIKVIMCAGVALMLLQALCELGKDILRLGGEGA